MLLLLIKYQSAVIMNKSKIIGKFCYSKTDETNMIFINHKYTKHPFFS